MAPRTPLLHPKQYFEHRGFELRPAAAAVGVAILAVVLAFAGFAVVLADRLRNAGHHGAANEVWGVFGPYLFGVVFVMLLGWVIAAGVVHLIARAALSHDGGFGQTLAVVGWGTAPTALTSLVAFAFLVAAVGDASMASPEAFAEQFQAGLDRSSVLRNAVGFLVAGWETYVYANGLAVAFDDRSGAPWGVAVLVAYGSWLLSLI
mgnify:CR=1 FL=1|jgi:hypothetical protein